ncbi:hypothetical protein DFH29DRAFT_1068580 [Suillus ampliporus]|nr:hypothetical protein DFH29DRAFT_1068580 [Suillus ampliporus]
MVSLSFYLFVSVIPCISTILAVQVHPVARAISSPATCNGEYSWMNDAQGYSPCLTVAYVEGACIGNNYEQPALMVDYSYSLPNSSSESPCYCSWSSYNLMMACTLCQGSNFTDSVWTWPTWASGCTANSSWTEEYFPSEYVLSGDASIPYWATTNPTSWTYATFNIQDSNATYSQNPSSVTPGASSSSSGSTSTSSSSSASSSNSNTDVGAIVGGTIGGAAALLLVVIGAYLLYRRHVYKKGASVINRQGTAFHTRSPSDSSNFAPSMSGPPVLYGQSLSPSPQNGTVYSSQPQTTYPSLQGSFSPPPRTDTSVYTTHTSSGQRSEAIPMV